MGNSIFFKLRVGGVSMRNMTESKDATSVDGNFLVEIDRQDCNITSFYAIQIKVAS